MHKNLCKRLLCAEKRLRSPLFSFDQLWWKDGAYSIGFIVVAGALDLAALTHSVLGLSLRSEMLGLASIAEILAGVVQRGSVTARADGSDSYRLRVLDSAW